MHRWLRNTHLFVGLFVFPMVLVYAISSLRFAHRDWFAAEPAVHQTSRSVERDRATDPRALARLLMEEDGLRGVVDDIKEEENGFRFTIGRIGTMYDIRYDRVSSQVTIRRNVANWMGFLVSLHVHAGTDTPYWVHNLWGVFAALAALGLVLLGATGIYLWFKMHEERLIGGILLFVGLGYGVALIAALRVG